MWYSMMAVYLVDSQPKSVDLVGGSTACLVLFYIHQTNGVTLCHDDSILKGGSVAYW